MLLVLPFDGLLALPSAYSSLLESVLFTLLQALSLGVVLLLAYLAFGHLLRRITESKLAKKNQQTILSLYKTFFLVFSLLAFLSLIGGSLENLGLSLGLLSVAIGYVFQKPLISIGGWLLLITRKPIRIGDRVMVGSNSGEKIIGDVLEINVFYILLEEKGRVSGTPDNKAGRIVYVPTTVVFEQQITNYSAGHGYVQDTQEFKVTFESNLGLAEQIAYRAAREATLEFRHGLGEPTILLSFQPEGVGVKVQYYCPYQQLGRAAREVVERIQEEVSKTPGVQFAIPLSMTAQHPAKKK